MSMQPTGQNPYDFITNDNKPKRSILGGGSGKKERILIVVAGAFGLIAVAAIVVGLITGSGAKPKEDLLSVAQAQTELIRIADAGTKRARSSATQNFAITAKTTLEADQIDTNALLKKAKVSADAKTLAAGKDPQIDQILTQAEQTNQFDEVFTKQFNALLTKYQATLKKAYDASTDKATKATLNNQYKHVEALLPAATTQ